MLKRTAAIAIFIAALISSSFAQQDLTVTDIQKLNEKIAELYRKGELEKVVELATKVADAERKISGENSENYAAALTNLGAAEKEAGASIRRSLLARYVVPRNQADKYLMEGRRKERDETAEKYASSAHEHFTSALSIYEKLKRDESLESAGIQGQLAWLTYAFRRGNSVAEGRAQIDKAEALYTASVAKFDRLNGASNDSALRIRLDFADFYYGFVNFEKALPLYETYVSLLAAKSGSEARQIPALKKLKAIADITQQESEAKNLKEKIAKFSGKNEDTRYPSLVLRSRKLEPVADIDFIPQRLSDPPPGADDDNNKPENRTIARAVIIEVLVNENGDVVEAKTISPNLSNKKVEAAAMASKFRPFIYNGTPRKMRGTIAYRFRD